MDFEFDPEKNDSNFVKHGILLEDSSAIWDGTVVNVPAKNVSGEKRVLTLGTIGTNVYAVVWTNRNGKRRLISARKATDKERSLYDGKTNH